MMTYSKSGEALTKQFEGCKLVAYQDVRGIWTVGFGHTGPEVIEGLTWTQDQADAQLMLDMASAQDCVNAKVTVALTQPEFDSLCDFVYNVGCGNFSASTLLKRLNQGDYQGAAGLFDEWDYAGGKQVAGLLRRREAERQQFEGV